EIVAEATPVDDEEVGLRLERGKHAVPGIHGNVDALARRGAEDARLGRRAVMVGSDDDEERALRQRIEGLAPEWMPLHHFEGQGQGVGLPAHQRDQRPRVGPAELDPCKVVVALRHAAIDRVVLRPGHFDHLPERRESLAAERLRLQRHGGHRQLASLPKRRMREMPPSGKMLRRIWVAGPTAATLSNLWIESADSFCCGSSSGQNIDAVTTAASSASPPSGMSPARIEQLSGKLPL